MKDFFVSYNGADRRWAEWISWQLEAAGYSVVVQAWDFVGNWVLDMDRAMKDSERTIAVLSPNYLNALYTHPEWADAFRRDPTGAKDLLIPVRVQDVPLDGVLANIVYVDLVGLDEAAAGKRLLDRVEGKRRKPDVAPQFPGGAGAPAARPAFPAAGATPAASGAPRAEGGGVPGLFHVPDAAWRSPIHRNAHRYKVVAFDLDGTLMRGEKYAFSWERIWTELRFAKSVRQQLRSEYRLKAEAGKGQRLDAYRNWCEQAVGHFRDRKLTRSQLAQFATGLHLTVKCREAMSALRDAGCVTAIISGGVHTFLEDGFPDFREFVDFVFINELTFDGDGVVAGVRATAFDFEGKAEALELVCRRAGCGPDEAVFVGDQFNDEAIMLRASLAIAYPPGDTVVEDTARVAIREDDLTRILPHVLVE